MQSFFLAAVRGYVKVEIRGGNFEQLLNLLVDRRCLPWDIVITNRQKAEMKMTVRDYFRLRPFLKQTGCRVHVLQRYGLPFFLNKVGRRKFFVAGMACFVVGLYLLSSVVWNVEVDGNEKLSDNQILQAARKEGIYPFQWKFRLKDPDALARGIQAHLPDAAWIGVEIRGTHIWIKVVESRKPQETPLSNPRNLVAAKNALVTEIYAEKGRPMVKPNTYVRKGDVLISGLVGNGMQAVVAKGKVKGLVWYTANIEVPLTQTYKVYTGENKNRSYLVIGKYGVQVTGYGKLPFDKYETVVNRTTLQWRQFTLPFGWQTEKLMEVRTDKQAVDPAAAKQMGLERARADLLVGAGPDSKITGEKVLHERTENGKVYMEVHFEVEEYIEQEQPIIQN